MNNPSVMICYVHRDDDRSYRDAVLTLAERLRGDGVACDIDQYHEDVAVPEGWPSWMQGRIQDSDFTLVVASPALRRRWEGLEDAGKGLGAVWEGTVVLTTLYDAGMKNSKFIPVGFVPYGEHRIGTPLQLHSTSYYDVSTEDGYECLLRRLLNQPRVKPAPLGPLRVFEASPEPPALEQAQGKSERSAPSQTPKVTGSRDWAIVGDAFCRATQYETDGKGNMSVRLVTEAADEVAYLHKLQAGGSSAQLRFAVGSMGGLARVTSIKGITRDGRSEFDVHVKLESADGGFEMAVGSGSHSYSADDIAKMRAELILLGTRPPRSRDGMDLLSGFVEGVHSAIRVTGPVIPGTSGLFKDDVEFLECARLHAVFVLLASNTVETVDKLVLGPIDGSKVKVEFSGTRRKIYSNEPATRIDLTGYCELPRKS